MTYLDFAATAPLTKASESAWLAAIERLRENPGNSSALHAGGRSAKRLLEDARERVADALGAKRTEVVFTSGATEANALAILGAARNAQIAPGESKREVIVTSPVEHDSVLKQESVARREGFGWRMLDVDAAGVTRLEEPDADWAVQSLAMVCAETGIIQPVLDMVQQSQNAGVISHTDAAQALGSIPVNFNELGVDLLTIGGHKVGAPVGTGALLVRSGINLATDRPGGGHERKIRSGSVDVAGAQALAAAIAEATQDLTKRQEHYRSLRARLLAGIGSVAALTSDADASPAIVHLSLPTTHPEILLMVMDRHGISVSAGSACHAGVVRPSELLIEMGRSPEAALGVLRISFGPSTTNRDIDRFVEVLPEALAAAQQLDD